MAVQTKAYLKERFESGDTPSEQDFADLIDSMVVVGSDYMTEAGGVVCHDGDVVTLT